MKKILATRLFDAPKRARRGRPETLLLPAKPWYVALTLTLAFFVNILPWSGDMLVIKPDFFALVLLFWCIHEPRAVGIGVAFVCGLLTDVVAMTPLGQHALAYTILGFSAGFFRRRVLRFAPWPQALHVGALLLVVILVVAALRLMAGGAALRVSWVLPAASGALLWPLVTLVLLKPLIPKEDQ